jgi:hypothetical protein
MTSSVDGTLLELDSTSYFVLIGVIKYRSMADQGWQEKFNAELARAELARSAGNEGKARVCARRAAGIVIGRYLDIRNVSHTNASAYDLLKYLLEDESQPPRVHELINHFLVRIDTDHHLPIDADLIQDARWLDRLLGSK